MKKHLDTPGLKAIVAVALAFLFFGFWIDDPYIKQIFINVTIWAMMGIAWNVFSGYTGLVSFGHAAFFGLGVYTVVILALEYDVTPWIGIPAGIVAGVIAGAIVGLPTFRLRGVYFALAMLAYPLTLLYVFEWLGYQEPTIPKKDSWTFMQFENDFNMLLIGVVLMSIAVWISSRIHASRFGLSLSALKQNELAAEGVGIDTKAWKLRAIMVSGGIAAAAGGFYAIVFLVATPNSAFGMLSSAQAMIVALFGGVSTVWGPVVGSLMLIPLSELFEATIGHYFLGTRGILLGVAIIAMMMYAQEGLFPKLREWLLRGRDEVLKPSAVDAPPALTEQTARVVGDEVVLRVSGLSKSFGGLKAVSDVSFEVKQGELLGVIGPNGAGKTTMFNLLNGFIRADAGRVEYDGYNLVGMAPNKVCALGVGRTFQVVRPFPRMSVLHNVVVGAYVRESDDDKAFDAARQALARVGMQAYEDVLAGGLNSLELRLMEIARVLAGRPKLLLLDETLAGLGGEEVEVVLAVIARLASEGQTIVIIEHTMQAMVRLVDRFVVLDHGSVLASGAPEEVTRNPEVVEAYLGKKWMEHANH
jgi:ABC-type branched-subunit amino acid transport system ATPase component/ABC-type branched-subunit amino acid transport system permease subunit